MSSLAREFVQRAIFWNSDATDNRGKNRGYKKKKFMDFSVPVVLRLLIRVAFVYF